MLGGIAFTAAVLGQTNRVEVKIVHAKPKTVFAQVSNYLKAQQGTATGVSNWVDPENLKAIAWRPSANAFLVEGTEYACKMASDLIQMYDVPRELLKVKVQVEKEGTVSKEWTFWLSKGEKAELQYTAESSAAFELRKLLPSSARVAFSSNQSFNEHSLLEFDLAATDQYDLTQAMIIGADESICRLSVLALGTWSESQGMKIRPLRDSGRSRSIFDQALPIELPSVRGVVLSGRR
jgi:hypothetical protein